jgi:hypothetical protein
LQQNRPNVVIGLSVADITSFRLDACEPDHPGPLFDLVGDDGLTEKPWLRSLRFKGL